MTPVCPKVQASLALLGEAKLFSKGLVPIYIPTRNGQIHEFSSNLLNLKKKINFNAFLFIHFYLYDLCFLYLQSHKNMTSSHKNKYHIIFFKFYNFDF